MPSDLSVNVHLAIEMYNVIVAAPGNRTTVTRDLRLESAHFILQSASYRINQKRSRAACIATRLAPLVEALGETTPSGLRRDNHAQRPSITPCRCINCAARALQSTEIGP